MTVWSIADLHLSFGRSDRRQRLAPRWRDHAARIEEQWHAVVGRGDLVLLPGDLSMAGNHREVQEDLAWIDRLPGTKVLAPGNHDRWWNGVASVRRLLRSSELAVGGDAVATCGAIVCGTLGVPAYHDPEAVPPSLRAAGERELAALDQALEAAARLRQHDQPVYVLWHYPPFDQHRRPGLCVPRLERAGVTACVYGHLHAEGQWSLAVQGTIGGVRYACVAADAIGFRPLRIDSRFNCSDKRGSE
jgi:predicted phosphohydrolase